MVVAVVDTGISRGGDDLDCHTFVHPYNAITGSEGLSATEDDHGHGTHVAGTIAQCTGNGIGAAGVAIDADLMPVKVLDSVGNGHISDVASGVDWARAHGAARPSWMDKPKGAFLLHTQLEDVMLAGVI